MAQAKVSITLLGTEYHIACDEGQEDHLAYLGRYVDEQASQLRDSTGPISDNVLLVMVSLLIADELSDVSGELNNKGRSGDGVASVEAEEEIVAAIETLTSRIDSVAERLEGE